MRGCVVIKLVGGVLVYISFIFFIASRNVSDWWLAFWISHTSDIVPNTNATSMLGSVPISTDKSPHLPFYLGIYGGLAASNTVSDCSDINTCVNIDLDTNTDLITDIDFLSSSLC